MVHATQTSAKTVMRLEMRAARRGLAEAMPEAARRAASRLPLDKLAPHTIVAGYRPQGSELDPLPLMQALGGAMALPVAIDREAPLVFRAWSPGDALEPDAFGIPSPASSAPEVAPDLVIVPLVAFDRRGGRLGQGGGCYDRTIETLRARQPVFVLGLAYAGQEVARTPAEPHDQRLDAIVTETGYIEAK